MRINRISQYWDKSDIPEEVELLFETWNRGNPEFIHDVYSKESAIALANSKFRTDVANAIEASWHPAMQADIFRLFVIYEHGGFYVDADHACHGSLKNYIDNSHSLLLVRRRTGTLVNSFFAAEAGNKYVKDALNAVLRNVNQGNKGKNIFWITGPGAIREFWHAGAEKKETLVLDWNVLINDLQTVHQLSYKGSNPWNVK